MYSIKLIGIIHVRVLYYLIFTRTDTRACFDCSGSPSCDVTVWSNAQSLWRTVMVNTLVLFSFKRFKIDFFWLEVEGGTHRAMKALQWLLMSRYWCIESVCQSVGTPLSWDGAHSSKWLSTESAIFWFWLNSNMLNISFAMGMFSY